MPSAAELNVKLGLEIGALERGIRNAERALMKMNARMTAIGNQLTYSLSVPLARFGVAAIKAAADAEQLRLALETTMKDAGRTTGEARQELEKLRDAAKLPGLDFEQAVRGSIRLQNVGFSAEKARKILVELANAVAMGGGSAQELDSVTRQFGQMIAKGRILQEDLSIIQENMPGISKAMEEAFGTKSADKLRAMGITAEKFIDGVTAKLAELPRVQGGLANSIVNAWSAVKNSLASIGDTLNETFGVSARLDGFANWLGSLAKRFSEADEATKRLVIGIGIFAAALGPAIKLTNLTMQAAGGLLVMWKELAVASKTVQGAGLIGWFEKLNVVTKANIIGVVTAAIIALTIAVGALSGKISEQSRIRQELNDIEKTAAQNSAEERTRVNLLTDVLKRETATRGEKAAALKDLQQKYPEYFGNLTLEKLKIEDVNRAQAAAIALLNQRARAAAAQEKLVDIEKKLIDLEARRQSGPSAEERFAASMGSVDAAKRFNEILSAQKKELESSRTSITDYITKNGGLITFRQEQEKSAPAVKSHTEALKEQAKAYRELDQESRFKSRKEAVTAMQKDIGGGVTPTTPTLNLLPPGLSSELDGVQEAGDRAANSLKALGEQGTIEGIQRMSATLMGLRDGITPVTERMSIMAQAVQAAGQEMFNAAAQGGASMKDLAKTAAASAAKVVRAWIMQGVASAVSKALSSIPFPFNLAAGAAAGALVGGLFNKLLSNIGIPALAEGGVVDKPTLALIGEAGPEAVVPLGSKFGGMMGAGQNMNITGRLVGSGNELLAVIERAQIQRQRIR